MGLPAILVVTAENQTLTARSLNGKRIACDLGWHEMLNSNDIAKVTSTLLIDCKQRFHMSREAQKTVDGEGVKRILSELKP
jgi:spore coat polysaccharide biosynthesis predicted glycosyltransferase SpsG